MNKYILVGGGNVGRGNTLYETEIIDKEAVKLTGKDNPNLLFIGLASSFSDSYYDTIKKIYKDLGCNTAYLKKKNIINNPQIVIDKINDADIIYFCGGDSIKLIQDVKEYKLDELFKNKDNCVFIGISAGTILLSKSGYSDSLIIRGENDKYEFVEGLNTIPINICPHYNDNYKKKELENEIDREVYGIEDKSCLIVEGNKYRTIGNVYKCFLDNNKYVEVMLKEEGLID